MTQTLSVLSFSDFQWFSCINGSCFGIKEKEKINTMISQYEIPALLEDAIPEMKETLVKNGMQADIFNAYKSVQCLTDFTLKSAGAHNIQMVKRCLKAAEKIYMKGNGIIKNAVENIFIYSFSTLFERCNSRREKIQIESLMPALLYSAYVQQVLKSNC